MKYCRIALFSVCFASCANPRPEPLQPADAVFDLLLRGGTIVDGTGGARYHADVGVREGRIVAIGDLRGARADTALDVSGLFVTPGFINLHSHAAAAALPTAANMLTQGVTTELINSDGMGPLDIAQQLTTLERGGLAVNVGAYAGFNSVWSALAGTENRRPGTTQLDSMSALLVANMHRGAWGVSAGLDYKPAYFATEAEVTEVLRPLGAWRTNFTNHDRVTPESGYSSRAGMLETMRIGHSTGVMPVITHMKVQGHEQGSAADILQRMTDATAQGRYTAADAYPYLAGQTALAALIIPGWAQEGGRPAMLQRFADPALRARIASEADEAIAMRFGGPSGVYIPATKTQLVDAMRTMGVTSAGEAVMRILQESSPGTIVRFGVEPDLVRILQHPTTSIACDCGASIVSTHPRYYGSFPRVLGRYVREQRVLTWEDAIRKMTALPAATIGLADRGVLAVGMAADIAVFDTATIIDHATYEEPMLPSDGVRHVVVNGSVALRDGQATNARAGRTLRRETWMPSRPMSFTVDRSVTVRGNVLAEDGSVLGSVEINASHRAGARSGTGTLRFVNVRSGETITTSALSVMQTTGGWASVTGLARVEPRGDTRAFTVYVESADPFLRGNPPTVTLQLDGAPIVRGIVRGGSISILPHR